MRLLLFLGAGVSVPSGLPTAAQLTDAVLSAAYHHVGKGVFRHGRHPEPDLRATDVTIRLRGFLRLVRRHDLRDIRRVGYYPYRGGFRSSGAIYRGPTTYEDLYFLCQQLSLWNIGLSDNSLTTPFMEALEQNAGDALQGRTIKARLSDLATLGELACYYIETIVADTLRREYKTGFGLLHELANAPGLDHLDIVTLNHDTLVEQYLHQNQISFTDGFGPPDGDVRWSNDAVYDAPSRVRLFKLHGSVNWYTFQTQGHSRIALLLSNDATTAKNAHGDFLTATLRRPSFLSGISKATAYARGIYADVHHRFGTVLRRTDRILMSGYGWGDTAINFQLDTWLDRSRDNTLILLHEHPEELANRSLLLQSAYDAHVRSGQLVPLKQWLSATRLADIVEHLRPRTQ
jgi:SIR2-like domain